MSLFFQFLARDSETIVLKEHVLSLTCDPFSIKLQNGMPILQVEEKLMSISRRKKVSEIGCNYLVGIVKEYFYVHFIFVIEDPKGRKLMEVKRGFKST